MSTLERALDIYFQEELISAVAVSIDRIYIQEDLMQGDHTCFCKAVSRPTNAPSSMHEA